jgi:pimeloyl-ACP methyl ester carboxylesterase
LAEIRTLRINSRQQLLAARLVDTGSKVMLIFLSGGGRLPFAENHYPVWQDRLAEQGISSLIFDYRGIGATEGLFGTTNLLTRFEDGDMAIKLLNNQFPEREIWLIGSSMGAAVAIELAKRGLAQGLILNAPAAYSTEAREAYFGLDFTTAITKPESWKLSPEFEGLKQLSMPVLLAYGEQDEVVPAEIFRRYASIVRSKSNGKVFAIPGAGHTFVRGHDEASRQACELFDSEIVRFAKTTR